jgi:hypothetical protein
MKEYMDLQHNRSISKPILSSTSRAEAFSIEQRNKDRKENSLKNKPILFLIEAEIGKRKFEVKVREGMTE